MRFTLGSKINFKNLVFFPLFYFLSYWLKKAITKAQTKIKRILTENNFTCMYTNLLRRDYDRSSILLFVDFDKRLLW